MSLDDITLPAESEEDFSSDGIQERELLFTIIDADTEVKENGDRYVFTFKNDELPFPVTVREWSKHTNPKAQEIGRGNIKRILVAATGQPRMVKSLVIGAQVKATVSDDGRGFATLKRFKSVQQTA